MLQSGSSQTKSIIAVEAPRLVPKGHALVEWLYQRKSFALRKIELTEELKEEYVVALAKVSRRRLQS